METWYIRSYILLMGLEQLYLEQALLESADIAAEVLLQMGLECCHR